MTDEEAKRLASEIHASANVRAKGRWLSLPRADCVLEAARLIVDEHAKDMVETTGNNDGVPNWLFCDGDGISGEKPPYCAAGVLWCFEIAGSPIPGNRWKQRECKAMLSGFLSRGRLITKPDYPKPGDVQFYYGRRTSDPVECVNQCHHVGIVEIVDKTEGVITTIEFNISNRSGRARTKIDSKSIIGWGRVF